MNWYKANRGVNLEATYIAGFSCHWNDDYLGLLLEELLMA